MHCSRKPLPMRTMVLLSVALLSLSFSREPRASATATRAAGPPAIPVAAGAFVMTKSIPAAATQAAAADERVVYGISNSEIVKYDRDSGVELGRSKGPAQHLNSGFLHAGKLYCAHSNYPRLPHQSDLRLLDPDTMQLSAFHTFVDPPGSITWAVRRDTQWWCHFAHYGSDNARSVLVQYDDGWRERARWTYPKELIAEWGAYSLSGGIWQGDDLLATGHDHKLLYRLRVPANSAVVEALEKIRAPFTGQGIALDPKTRHLVGIDRGRKRIVFARYEEAPPPR
jgi:hypothetical protein